MRRRRAEQKPMPIDMKYKDELVGKFIVSMMRKGKRTVAERILYQAFDIIKEKTKKDPLEVFKQAVENVKPQLEVRSRRVGGAVYQIPYEVRPKRQLSLVFRWLIMYAKQRKGKPMAERLASELLDAYNNTGGAIKKKEDTHKMAEANKAFSHYRI